MCSAVRGFVRRPFSAPLIFQAITIRSQLLPGRIVTGVRCDPNLKIIRIYNGTKAFICFGKTMRRSWIRVLNLVNRARALAGNWAPRRGAPRIIVA